MQFLLSLLFLLVPVASLAQSTLPQCPPRGIKHMCFGERTAKNTGGIEMTYVGEFKNDTKDGRGTLTIANGDKYVGDFKDDTYSGQGAYTYASGEKYVGEYKNSKRNGHGIEYTSNGTIRQSGNWADGKLVQSFAIEARRFPFNEEANSRRASALPPCPAVGTKHMCFGELSGRNAGGIDWKWVGEIMRDQASGAGTMSFSNGEIYVGEWKDYKAEGQGVYTWPDGEKYIGQFKDGKSHGQGTTFYASGKKYVGEWKSDRKHGRGTYTWADGEKYVGDFKDGVRNGQGIQYLPNGTVKQSGNWEDDKLAQSFPIDVSRFPFNADTLLAAVKPQADPLKAERDRLAAEADAARKRQQELEERLAQERAEKERLAAQVANQAALPVRSAPVVASRNERRVALIVGNAKYAYNPLDNPVNDASDLDAALKSLGFKTTLLRDATMAQMRNATRQFADDVATSDVALIFFAGHGIEARGRNYLLPVSADIKHEFELEDQAYDAGRWLDMLENIKGTNRQRINIVILDACRNNDLARGWRSSSRGLARMDAPTGTFIAFATAPGKVAMDGAKGQRNSPFTKNLLRAIQTPDVPIELMFKEVRRLVLEDTKNEQVPWDNSSLVGDFVFKKSR